jgi:hypothetical protein
VKGVGDREILETYLNSASRESSETDIFPHGTNSLLTSVIGDLYTQIGKEKIYYPTIEKEAFHQESNKNRKRLIHFAASRNMVIGSTLFQHTEIHKLTWRSPDTLYFNHIDHLLIDSPHFSHLMDVKSHKYASVDPNNYLNVSRIRVIISNAKNYLVKSLENTIKKK